jgi:hypothetical protein
MRTPLAPYFELTCAVRSGDLAQFRAVSEKFAAAFRADRTTNLITRLQYNVIRTGLRRINLAYSRISLKVRGAGAACRMWLRTRTLGDDARAWTTCTAQQGALRGLCIAHAQLAKHPSNPHCVPLFLLVTLYAAHAVAGRGGEAGAALCG